MSLVAMLEAIEDADLPIAVYRTAVRLARLADATGTVSLSWEAYQALTGCGHVDAARRHLRQMHAAGLIEWSGGKTVVVRWTAQLLPENAQLLRGDAQQMSEDAQLLRGDAQQMSEDAQLLRGDNSDGDENAQQVSENRQLLRVDNNDGGENAQLLRGNAQQMSEDAQLLRGEEPERAATARKQAATARSPHTRTRERALVDCLIDLPDPEIDTNQSNNQARVREEDCDRAEALLVEVGIAPDKAKALAEHGFDFVRRAVAHWFTQRKEVGGRYDNHPGIVIYWLANPGKAGLPSQLPAEWFYSELGRKYAAPEDPIPALDGGSEFGAGVPVAKASDLAEEAGDWAMLVRELALSLPGNETVKAWLAQSRLVAAGEVEGVPLYRVELPDPAGVGWVRDRLGPRLRRDVSALVGEKVLVEVAHG